MSRVPSPPRPFLGSASLPLATRHRREEVWLRAVEALLTSPTIGSWNASKLANTADLVLAAFDARFGAPESGRP